MTHIQKSFPAKIESRLPQVLFLLSILLFLGYAAYFYRSAYSIFDDSFITFRYADNLAHGHGLVFNPGERVEGYTTFLWAVLMAGAIRLGWDVVAVSQIVGTVAGLGILWLMFSLGKHYQQPLAGALATMMLASTAGFARYAVSGFEMLFFTFLILLGMTLYLKAIERGGQLGWAGIVFALAAMTRPEGALVFGLVSLHFLAFLWRHNSTDVRAKFTRFGVWAVNFGVLYGTYFLWRWHFYGYLLPNTFYVKAGGFGFTLFRRGLLYLLLMTFIANPQLFLLGIAGFWWKNNRVPKNTFRVVIAGYLFYLMLVGGDDFKNFGIRFLLPLLPLIYFLGLMGITEKFLNLKPSWRIKTLIALAATWIMLLVGWSAPERNTYNTIINLHWIDLAQWVQIYAQPDDTLAVDAAGTLPFYTGLGTIDMLGLNDIHIAHLPKIVGAGTAGHEKSDPAYVLAQKPTFITSWLDHSGNPITAGLPAVADEFSRHYRLRAVVLMHTPADPNVPLIVDGATFTPALYRLGYVYGLFERMD